MPSYPPRGRDLTTPEVLPPTSELIETPAMMEMVIQFSY